MLLSDALLAKEKAQKVILLSDALLAKERALDPCACLATCLPAPASSVTALGPEVTAAPAAPAIPPAAPVGTPVDYNRVADATVAAALTAALAMDQLRNEVTAPSAVPVADGHVPLKPSVVGVPETACDASGGSTDPASKGNAGEALQQPGTDATSRSSLSRRSSIWKPDDESRSCDMCNSIFSLINRRHHCRQCGGIFCGSCSEQKLPVLGYQGDQRVCDRCASEILDLTGDEDGKRLRSTHPQVDFPST